MTTISNNKIQILEENFNNSEAISFSDFVKSEAENDPNFFRFLFDEDFEDDFDKSLTEEQREAYEEFLSEIE